MENRRVSELFATKARVDGDKERKKNRSAEILRQTGFFFFFFFFSPPFFLLFVCELIVVPTL